MKQEKKAKVATDSKAPSKLPKVDSKLTAKVNEAQTALENYLKKNKLDPSKDWSKDKKHGSKVKELVSILNVARKKVEEAAPKEIHHKKSEDKGKAPKEAKSKTTYSYPKVDGKEMTSAEKKRYRQKMRAGKTESEAIKFAKELPGASVKATPAKKEAPVETKKASSVSKLDKPAESKAGKKKLKKGSKKKTASRNED